MKTLERREVVKQDQVEAAVPWHKRTLTRVVAVGAIAFAAFGVGVSVNGGSDEEPRALAEETPSTENTISTPNTTEVEVSTTFDTVSGHIEERVPNDVRVEDLVTSSDPEEIVQGVFSNIEFGLNNESVDHILISFPPRQTEIPRRMIDAIDEIESEERNPEGLFYHYEVRILEGANNPTNSGQFRVTIETSEGRAGYQPIVRTIDQEFILGEITVDGQVHQTWQILGGTDV